MKPNCTLYNDRVSTWNPIYIRYNEQIGIRNPSFTLYESVLETQYVICAKNESVRENQFVNYIMSESVHETQFVLCITNKSVHEKRGLWHWFNVHSGVTSTLTRFESWSCIRSCENILIVLVYIVLQYWLHILKIYCVILYFSALYISIF